jgi:hypothetical protein
VRFEHLANQPSPEPLTARARQIFTAAVIADRARTRHDLRPLRAGDEISTGLADARRPDKSTFRVRAIDGLQTDLKALERSFDYGRSEAALMLLSKYRAPEGICHAGQTRIDASLKRAVPVLCGHCCSSDRGRQVPAYDCFRPASGEGIVPQSPGRSWR